MQGFGKVVRIELWPIKKGGMPKKQSNFGEVSGEDLKQWCKLPEIVFTDAFCSFIGDYGCSKISLF